MKMVLERLPRFQIRDFVNSHIFTRPTIKGVFNVGGFPVSFRTDLMDMTIEFTATGPDRNQVVSKLGLVQRPTNLGNGNMWLFYSFQSLTTCRVLYLVNGTVVCRNDLACPRYKQQLLCRTRRFCTRYGRYSHPPIRTYGKRTYRGKLTPYGKRLKRYNDIASKMEWPIFVYLANRFQMWEDNELLRPLKGLNL